MKWLGLQPEKRRAIGLKPKLLLHRRPPPGECASSSSVIRLRTRYTRAHARPQTEVLITVAGSETARFVLTPGVPVTGTDAWEVVGKVGRGEIEPLGAATSKSPDAAKPRSGEQASQRETGRLRSRPSHIPDSLAAIVRKAMSLDRAAREAAVAKTALANLKADACPGEAHTGPRPATEFWKAHDAWRARQKQ